MSRHAARERALQTLFQMDINHMDVEMAVRATGSMLEETAYDEAFYRDLLTGVNREQSPIDQIVATYSEDWRVDRMPLVDLNVLRIAVFELVYAADLPHAVVMDEAVLLCKEYGTERSAKFVNGVLAGVLKDLELLRTRAHRTAT